MLPKDPCLHPSNILSNSQWIQYRKIKMRLTSLQVSCHPVELNWDQTISQSSYGSSTIVPFCVSHVFSVPGLGLCRLHVTCCLSPATLLPQGPGCHLGMEMCCAVSSVLVTSYLAALGEVQGSLMDMWHPGVKENYHYKKNLIFSCL